MPHTRKKAGSSRGGRSVPQQRQKSRTPVSRQPGRDPARGAVDRGQVTGAGGFTGATGSTGFAPAPNFITNEGKFIFVTPLPQGIAAGSRPKRFEQFAAGRPDTDEERLTRRLIQEGGGFTDARGASGFAKSPTTDVGTQPGSIQQGLGAFPAALSTAVGLALPGRLGKRKAISAFGGSRKELAEFAKSKGLKVPKKLKDIQQMLIDRRLLPEGPGGAASGKLLGEGRDALSKEITGRSLFEGLQNFAREGSQVLAHQEAKFAAKKNAMQKLANIDAPFSKLNAVAERDAAIAIKNEEMINRINTLITENRPISPKGEQVTSRIVRKFFSNTGKTETIITSEAGNIRSLPGLNRKSWTLYQKIMLGVVGITTTTGITGMLLAVAYGGVKEFFEGANFVAGAIIKDGKFNDDPEAILDGIQLLKKAKDIKDNPEGFENIPLIGRIIGAGRVNSAATEALIDDGINALTKLEMEREWQEAGGEPNFTTKEGEEILVTPDGQIIFKPATSNDFNFVEQIAFQDRKQAGQRKTDELNNNLIRSRQREKFRLDKELARFEHKLALELLKEQERLNKENVERWIEYLRLKARLAQEGQRSQLGFGLF